MAQQEELQIVITAKDEASKALGSLSSKVKTASQETKNLSSNTDKHTVSLGKMVAAVGLGNLAFSAAQKAVSFVTTTIKDSIKAAKDAEVSQEKVNATLRTLKLSHDEVAKAMHRAAVGAQELAFDDEDAAESMAKLLQVTGNSATAQRAFSAAMDLSRMKGIDLASATQQINLALDGNGKVLSELNVQVPKNASQMDVLGLVLQRVGGQAEGFANSAEGANERYKVSMENLQEKIGGFVLPVVTNFFNTVSRFISSSQFEWWLDTINTKAKNLAQSIRDNVRPVFEALSNFIRISLMPIWEAIGQVFRETYIMLEPYIPTLKEIIKWIALLAGGAIVGGLIVLSTTVLGLATAFKTVLGWIKEVFNWIERVMIKFADFTKATTGKVSGAVGNVGDFFKGIFKAEGGPITAGKPYIVGERGPEMIIPKNSGTVIPNKDMGAISGPTINFNGITVRTDQDIQTIIAQVMDALGRRSDLARKGIY